MTVQKDRGARLDPCARLLYAGLASGGLPLNNGLTVVKIFLYTAWYIGKARRKLDHESQ